MAKTHTEAFVGKSGAFYVLKSNGNLFVDPNPQYAKRPSVSAYNNREGYPDYVSVAEAMADFGHEVRIDPSTLTV